MPKNVQRLSWGNQYARFWSTLRVKTLNILRIHGYTYAECANVLATTEQSCRKAVYRYKPLCRLKGNRSEHAMKLLEFKVSQLSEPGITDKRIAEKLAKEGIEVTPNYVVKIRKKLGIPSGCGWGGKRVKGTNPQGT